MYYVRTFDSTLGLMPAEVYGPYSNKIIAGILAYLIQLDPGVTAVITED